MAYKGESKASVPIQREGMEDEKKNFIVVTRKKRLLRMERLRLEL